MVYHKLLSWDLIRFSLFISDLQFHVKNISVDYDMLAVDMYNTAHIWRGKKEREKKKKKNANQKQYARQLRSGTHLV